MTPDRKYALDMLVEGAYWDESDDDLDELDTEPDMELRGQMGVILHKLRAGDDQGAADAADHLKTMLEINYGAHKDRDPDDPMPERQTEENAR